MEIRGVTEFVVHDLRGQIITGELSPGQMLNESQLASSLGVSRPPLREAFRILEQEHLLVSVPRKRTYVTEISVNDFREVYQARQMIEFFSVDLLEAQHIRDLPLVESALAAEAASLAEPPAQDREQRLLRLKVFADFHLKLVESAGNSRLVRFYHGISSSLARYQFIFIFVAGAGIDCVDQHRMILDLIKAAKYEESKKHLKSHINDVFDTIKEKVFTSNRKNYVDTEVHKHPLLPHLSNHAAG